MNRTKTCPECGIVNDAKLAECPCGYDLSIVAIDSVSHGEKKETTSQDSAQKTVLYHKICDHCKHSNKSTAKICEKCSSEINHVPATIKEESTKYYLEMLDPFERIEITEPITLIGRSHMFSKSLEKKMYVSRLHAKIIIINHQLLISHESSSNPTYINNQKLENKIPFKLKDGDEIGLGGHSLNGLKQDLAAYIKVKIS